MMALESSVLGCGSDDWSVDSEYTFQDFKDDAKRVEHVQSPSTSEPMHQDIGGGITSCSSRSSVNTASEGSRSIEEETAKWNICALSHGKVEEAPMSATTVAIPDEIDAALTRRESAGEGGKGTACFEGSEHEHLPFAPGVRFLGDPGSSSDSSHVLRLEQRMFLKVKTHGFVGFASGSQMVFTRDNLPFHEQPEITPFPSPG